MKWRLLIAYALTLMIGVSVACAQDDEVNPAQKFSDMLQGKKFDEAATYLEELLGQEPENLRYSAMRQQLAMALVQAGKNDAAIEQINKMVDQSMARLDSEASVGRAVSAVSMSAMILRRAGKADQVMPQIEKAITKIAELADSSNANPKSQALLALNLLKGQNLVTDGKAADGLAIMKSELDRVNGWLAQSDTEAIAGLKTNILSTLLRSVENADERQNLFGEIDTFVKAQLEAHPERFGLVNNWINAVGMTVSMNMDADPDGAEKMLDSATEFANGLIENNEQAKKALERSIGSLSSLKNRIASTRKMMEMIGQAAPEFDAQSWVNATGFDPAQLKGKVVLLDFWAVWCGPCIATFPHLKHWQEAYGPDGLQIVGVTRQYNYVWDAEGDQAKRLEEGEASMEQESAMLEKFIAKHELKHPSMVTPKDSEMYKNFGVSGIPHAVVIDRQGRVRLIKVGSGDANAKALEAMIKECLAEKAN